jgi:integrase
MTPELRRCLEEQRTYTDAVQREKGQIIPFVVPRTVTSRRKKMSRAGVAVRGFRKAWFTACKRAGVPGRIPHDFRRTAIRNLERGGCAKVGCHEDGGP